MNLWHFNTFFCISDLIMMFLLSVRASRLAKMRYPELHFQTVAWETRLFNLIKAILVSACPGFNIVMLYTLLAKEENIIESTIEDMREKYLKETHNGDNTIQTSEDSPTV